MVSIRLSRTLCILVIVGLAAVSSIHAQLVEQSYRYSALEERSVRHLIDAGMIRRAHAALRALTGFQGSAVRDVVPFDAAEIDRASENRSAADRQMQTFIRTRPNSPRIAIAWMERGLAALEEGDDRAAADYMHQAASVSLMEFDRRHDTVYRDMSHSALFWQAAAMSRTGMFGEALNVFHASIRADSMGEYADRSWYAIGQLYEQNRQFDSAIVAFRQIREHYPRRPFHLAARIRESQNLLVVRQPERTLDVLTGTAAIDASTQMYAESAPEQIMVLRAEALALRGMAKQANDSCEAFLVRYPTSAFRWYVHLDAGSTALQLGQYASARDHYRTVIDSVPDESSSLRQLALLYHAVALKKLNMMNDAIAAFQGLSVQAGYPYQAQALLELGQCYYEEGDFDRARKQLERAEKESRDAVTSIRTLLLLGATYVEQGQWSKAAGTYERAEQMAQAGTEAFMPDKERYLAEARLKRGISLVQANQMRTAIGALTDFLGNHPTDARRDEATFWLAEAFYRNDLLKNAQELYEEVINRFTASPRREEAMYGLAWTYFRRRDFERSVRRFGEMASTFPASRFVADALARRGDGFYILKQYHAAAEAYREAARRSPNADEGQYAAYQVGQAQYRNNELEASQRSMREYAERYPKSGLADDALYLVGWIAFQQHNYPVAIASLQEMLTTYPNGDQAVRALYTIADAQYNSGDLESSLETSRQVIARYPSHPLAFEATKSMQFALVGLGRTEEALLVADAYINANPQSLAAESLTRTKAEIFYSGKNYASAALELEAFMKKYPSADRQDESLFLLGKTYLNMDDVAQARTAFTELEKKYTKSSFISQSKLELAGYYNKAANGAAADSLYHIIVTSFADDTATASEAGYERAMLQKMKGDSIRAIENFELIANRYPATEYGDQSRYQTAMYYRKNKQWDSARYHFASLAERNDNPGLAAEALYRIGEIYIRDKQIEQAIPYLKKVREELAGAEDWYTLSLLALGECYEALKLIDEAKDVYSVIASLRPDDDYGKAAAARLKRLAKAGGRQ
ncbi:tetratricopeptide repeat protein [soil metagenome]